MMAPSPTSDPESGLSLARALATRIGQALARVGQTVATAESCTGGLVGSVLTDIPGSSDYMLGGVIAYSDVVKRELLGVPQSALDEHGAVSEPVALAMSHGARQRFGSDFAVAVTGIAGPTGGSSEKPVGLVYVAVATPEGNRCSRFVWGGNRLQNKVESVIAALQMLEEVLRDLP